MSYVIGVDIGTSGTKALVITAEGELVGQATVEYPLHHPQPGWAEQDAEDWWRATCQAIQKARQAAGIKAEEVKGVGLSGQMHGSVLIDREGKVVRPPILWCDTRTTEACRYIEEKVGVTQLLQATGNPALEGFTAPKLVWLAQNEPESLEKAATVFLPKDYINYRLTGEIVTEMSDAAGSLLFNVAAGDWAEDVVDKLGLPSYILPPVKHSWEAIGEITPAAAAATGLLPGIPVAGGGADNACGAVGAGVVEPGQALSSIGSSGVILAPLASPAVSPDGKLHLFNHAAPDRWYLMGVMLAAGLSYQWFRRELGHLEVQQAEAGGRSPYQLMDEAAASVPAGAGGVIFLPYLNGERTPHADANARGVFFGISSAHHRAHLIRAVMEGITYGLRDSVVLMREAGQAIKSLRAIGGGAKSPLWLQMQADIMQAVVEVPRIDEGPAFGAGLLAAVAAGIYKDITEAVKATVKIRTSYEPDAGLAAIYDRTYEIYRDLYPALRPLFARARKAVAGVGQ